MARRYNSEEAKKRILAACARLFLEKGYTNTRVAEVLKAADVSASTFQNIFRTKDGVLTEFVRIMFGSQFGAAKQMAVNAPSPAHVYAAETALQLALTEMNENLRDVYLEAYTYPETMEIICRRTAMELQAAFSAYLPEYTESDFYETDLGTGGMTTKLNAAELAMKAGVDMVITNGSRMEDLYGIAEGKDIGTRFVSGKTRK